MERAKVPPTAKILVELGTARPKVAGFDPFVPFKCLWVLADGVSEYRLLWITTRKTGLYVASAGPGQMHTSYHRDGRFHWRSIHHTTILERRTPLREIREPVLVQNATIAITPEAIECFELPRFVGATADQVVYLDRRSLPDDLYYHVWAVPPFEHYNVPLITEKPAHIHIATHTNPWIEVVIYEDGQRRKRSSAA